MTDRERVTTSKFISLILRHKPEKAGIALDENGWADVCALLEGVNKYGRVAFTFDDLKELVATNEKRRFAFNDDCTKIRANQGHSVTVDVDLTEAQPPEILYHGTSSKSLDSILKTGIKALERLYVHLSIDVKTAYNVGDRRRGEPTVLVVDALKMHKDGIKFFLSANGIWLTAFVPVEYIRILPAPLHNSNG